MSENMNDDTSAEDEWAAYQAEEQLKADRRSEPPPAITAEEFQQWRSPRVVSGGPVSLDNPLWHWLVRTRFDAWNANETFHGPSAFKDGPMWCFDRYGQSVTPLPDGRVVYVGGEHEDYYDPDFFIYNDVVVIEPDGRIHIHGYGLDVFAPTDFHSATLVGTSLYIVGRLGNREERQRDVTPVYVLDVEQLMIRRLDTEGPAPGWIHRHTATLSEDQRTITISGGEVWLSQEGSLQENLDLWSLNVETNRWERLTARDWQRWTMQPVNRMRYRLWDVRRELWRRDHGWAGMESDWRHEEAPDLAALDALYRIDEHAPAPEEGDEHNVYVAVIDGVRVRFTEEDRHVHAVVEGRLSDVRLEQLQAKTLKTLEALNGSAWMIEPPQ